MASGSIIAQLGILRQHGLCRAGRNLCELASEPGRLPGFVRQSPVAMRYLDLLGPMAWNRLPERDLTLGWPVEPVPYAALLAACLIKLDQGLSTMGALRRYLSEEPALVWLCGFRLAQSRQFAWRFDADASLPTQKHFSRMLRTMPNSVPQFLLSSSVALIWAELSALVANLGESISLDTKHVIAWVKENNPKAYMAGKRYDKEQQPKGDPDCRLGCKRRSNQRNSQEQSNGKSEASTGEFYWGYGSGVVAVQVPGWGEFVLAELTQPFDQGDASYFLPLMKEVERRLGFRPKYGAFDAAFDAFYVYEYFHEAGGFAAVPFVERGGVKERRFSAEGLPLCQAGLAMPLRYTFIDRKALVEHEAGRYVCPLLFPEATGQTCPVNHKQWCKGGCISTLATSVGARLRYQLDRQSDDYKAVYRQRTATERINSQAVDLGIERPKVRNGQAVTNLNTLTYVLINLRLLQRIRQRLVGGQSASQND